jgi:type VI protein secretion system component VasK
VAATLWPGLSVNEWMAIVGGVSAVVTALTSIYFRRRDSKATEAAAKASAEQARSTSELMIARDRREAEEHNKFMKTGNDRRTPTRKGNS